MREFMGHDCDEGFRTFEAVLADANADGISLKRRTAKERERSWYAHLSSDALDTVAGPICAG